MGDNVMGNMRDYIARQLVMMASIEVAKGDKESLEKALRYLGWARRSECERLGPILISALGDLDQAMRSEGTEFNRCMARAVKKIKQRLEAMKRQEGVND